MEYRRIFKDGVHLLAGKAGTSIIGLVLLVILARALSTEEMGKYSLFLMIVNLALVIGLNWSDSSIVRHGREEYISSRKINKSFWARMYLFIPVILGITILLFIFSGPVSNYIGIEKKYTFLIISVFILNGLLNFITYIYQSVDEMKKSAYILLSQKAIFLAAIIFVLAGGKATLTLVLAMLSLSFLVSVVMNLFFFNYQRIMPYSFDKNYIKKIWNYSWPQLIGFPGLYIVSYIDIFVIKKFMTLHDVGVYNVAYSGFTVITGLLMVYYTVFFPLIVEYKTKHEHNKIRGYLQKIPAYAGAWAVAAGIGLLFSNFFITLLFSAKYTEAIVPFNILLLASIFYFASICMLPVVNAFDLILYSQIFNLAKAGVNIGADFLLVPKIGIAGAAYGTLISYFAGTMLTIILLYANRKKWSSAQNEHSAKAWSVKND